MEIKNLDRVIVKLGIKDIDKIFSLAFEQFGTESWTKQQFVDSIISTQTKFFGIFDGDNLVCFASILITIDDINLLDIATANSHKRRGLAKQMLRYLIKLKNKDQTFSLEVKSKNLPAIKLYESFGLKTLNIRRNYYKDGDDALCMFLNR